MQQNNTDFLGSDDLRSPLISQFCGPSHAPKRKFIFDDRREYALNFIM